MRIGSKPVSSRPIRFESGRVLVSQRGVFGCSSRMMGNLQVRFLEGWASAMASGHSTTGFFGSRTAGRVVPNRSFGQSIGARRRKWLRAARESRLRQDMACLGPYRHKKGRVPLRDDMRCTSPYHQKNERVPSPAFGTSGWTRPASTLALICMPLQSSISLLDTCPEVMRA